MRITFKMTTAGERGMTHFPILPRSGEDYCGDDGRAIEAMVRHDLANAEGIQFSADDNKVSLAFAVEFLDRVKITYANFRHANPGSLEPHIRNDDGRRDLCEKKMDRGKVAFVRVDIRTNASGIRVALSYDNPRSVVGEAENFASIIALSFADIITTICEDIKGQGAFVTLVEGKNCAGIFAKSAKRVQMRLWYDEHKDCTSKHGEFCSPPDFKCPFYKDGACRYGKLTCDADL